MLNRRTNSILRFYTSTLINRIYTNDKINPTASGVLTTSDLSNHHGIFTIISEGIDKKPPSKQNCVVRDMSNFRTEEFLDYRHIKLGNLFENNWYSANKLFDNFISIFTEVVDLFAPKRNATRKEKSSSSNPGLLLPCLNLFKPITKCLNVCIKTATI